MTFTKKKLAAAIGGTLLASVGVQTTQAAVDLDNTASIGLKYASEIVIGTSGVALSHADLMDVNGIMALNGVQATTDIRVTLTLSSGTFTAPPAMKIVNAALADLACVVATSVSITACAATTLFTGGTTADSSVTFNTATGTSTIIPGAHFSFEMAGVTVPNQSAVTATVTTVSADSFGPTSLPTKTGPYLSFVPLLSLLADTTTATPQAIDVAQNSLFFAAGATGDNTINVGGVRVVEDVSGTAGLGVATVAIDATDIISGAGHTITAANGFAAFDQGTAIAGESIKVNGVAAVVSTADSTLAVAATAAVPAGGNLASSQDVILTAPTANTVTIAETTLTDTVTSITAGAVYSAATSTGTVALNSLTRNGSAARLTFSVNPTSPYPMSIRVTNDSAVVGPTTLTLTNDDGATSAAINITAITGGPAADLASGASTGLLSMADVYAAVQAADATFALGASSNKLRVNVTSLTPTIVLNAFSLSSDGTTFSMVTDAGA
jgi:hypothetical protein